MLVQHSGVCVCAVRIVDPKSAFDTMFNYSMFNNIVIINVLMYLLLDWQGSSHIGGRKVNGIWRWQGRVTGKIGYKLWGASEPSGDGDCIMIAQNMNYKFNDSPCTSTSFCFFCERADN